MAHLTLLGIVSILLRVVLCSLAVWAGILLFRYRGMAGWTALLGSTLGAVSTVLASVWPLLGNFLHSPGSDEWLLTYQILYLIAGVGDLALLGAVVMHLLKKTAEADHIEQLEAIIRDRDQMS
jgi:hypothetical protein